MPLKRHDHLRGTELHPPLGAAALNPVDGVTVTTYPLTLQVSAQAHRLLFPDGTLAANIATTGGSEALTWGNATVNPTYSFVGSGAFTVGGPLQVDGAHLRLSIGADPTVATDKGYLYLKTVSTLEELHYRADGGITQLTHNGGLNAAALRIASQATSDLLVAASATAFGRLGVGLDGQVLTVSGTAVVWATPGAIPPPASTTDILINDNEANAFRVREANNNYFRVSTTNAAEAIQYGNATTNPLHSFLGTGAFSVAGAATFSATLEVSGATTLAAVTANGAAALNSTLVVAGATNLNGNTTIGDASTDTVTFTAQVASNLTFTTATRTISIAAQTAVGVAGSGLLLRGAVGGPADAANNGGRGGDCTVFGATGGPGSATNVSGGGGHLNLVGGNAGASGGFGQLDGGNVYIDGGLGTPVGRIFIGAQRSAAVEIGNATDNSTVRFLGSGLLSTVASMAIGSDQGPADSRLHVYAGNAGVIAAAANTVITAENSTSAFISILTPNTAIGGIYFGDVDVATVGSVQYDHSTDRLGLFAGAAERWALVQGHVYHRSTTKVNSETQEQNDYVQTTTVATTTLLTLAVGSNTQSGWVEVMVTATQVGSNVTSAAYYRLLRFERDAAGVWTFTSIVADADSEDIASWALDITGSGGNILVRVIGQAATTINWAGTARWQRSLA